MTKITIFTGESYSHTYREQTISKGCYNIKSGEPAAATVVLNSLKCSYTVQTYPFKNCHRLESIHGTIDGSNRNLYPLNNRNWVINLNRLPICSFKIYFVPSDRSHIRVKFFKSGLPYYSKDVNEANCYNICDANFKYPDSVELYHNGNIALGY